MSLTDYNKIVVKEKVRVFMNEYTLYSEEGQQVGYIKERMSVWRFLLKRIFSPTKVTMFDADNQVVATMSKGWSFLRSTFKVNDGQGQQLVTIRSKITLLKQKYNYFDANQQEVGYLEGNWLSWDFQITNPQEELLCTITKKWNGAMKEIFTTADTYIVEIESRVTDVKMRTALLMSACSIDLICHEE